MRFLASEKLESLRTLEGSHLPSKKTLDMLGIPRTTFYRWYDRYLEGGFGPLKRGRNPTPPSDVEPDVGQRGAHFSGR